MLLLMAELDVNSFYGVYLGLLRVESGARVCLQRAGGASDRGRRAVAALSIELVKARSVFR